MSRTKPIVLARQQWGKRVTIEVRVDADDRLRREIRGVRKTFRSLVLCELFVLVSKGTNTPTELAKITKKSKFAVSLQLSDLRKTGLVRDRSVVGWDLRRKRYDVVWERIAEIFRQDHALELELYENHIIAETMQEIKGTINKTGLVISGSGKLGLVRTVNPDRVLRIDPQKQGQVNKRLNRLISEFVELFKAYLRERRFPTIREYFLGAYDEISERYGKLPRKSELARFFEFMDTTFARIEPIEDLWRTSVGKSNKPITTSYKRTGYREYALKLFTEAGSADPVGRYLLNAEAQPAIKPGTPLRIYPSYTYDEP